MKPRFEVGDGDMMDGFEWRVVRGTKAPEDMAIEVRCPEWVRPRMALVFLLADFHYQVEDILFPRKEGKAGGEYFLAAIAEACQELGFRSVAARVQRERVGGSAPRRTRYNQAPPYDGREEDGALVGRIRTTLSHLMWREGNPSAAALLDWVQDAVDNYREHVGES